MRKSIKVMIEKAEAIVRIWKYGEFAGPREDAMDKMVEETEEAIKKVKGEA